MTWNPRDVTAPKQNELQQDGSFTFPSPPLATGPGAGGAPYLPTATPTVAEAMGWDENDALVAMPPEFERELEYEGVFSSKQWDRWRTILLRGHYE